MKVTTWCASLRSPHLRFALKYCGPSIGRSTPSYSIRFRSQVASHSFEPPQASKLEETPAPSTEWTHRAKPVEGPPVSSMVYRVPVLATRIVGRQEELRLLWQQQLSGKHMQILYGVDGIGKTSLATEFCERAKYSGRFSCVLWVVAGSCIEAQLERLFETLRGRAERTILLVIDGVKDVKGLLAQLPKHEQLYYLITTTDVEADVRKEKSEVGFTMVKPLSLPDAREIQSAAQSSVSDQAAADKLYEYCEYVPLLVQLVIPLLTVGNMSPKTVLEALETQSPRVSGAVSVSSTTRVLVQLALDCAEKLCPGVTQSIARCSWLYFTALTEMSLSTVLAVSASQMTQELFVSVASQFHLLSPEWESSAFVMHPTVAGVLQPRVSVEEANALSAKIAALWPRRWRDVEKASAMPIIWHTYALMQCYKKEVVGEKACGGGRLPDTLQHALDRSATFLAHFAGENLPLAAEMWFEVFCCHEKRCSSSSEIKGEVDLSNRAITKEGIRIGRECGRLLHYLRNEKAPRVLSVTAEWCKKYHGEQSVEYALVLSILAPYLFASLVHIALLMQCVESIEVGLTSNHNIVSVEERRMLEESKFVLLLRVGQMKKESGQNVSDDFWDMLRDMEENLTKKK